MKHCVITGVASGIGAALAWRYARAGYEIIGVDRNAPLANTLKQKLESGGFAMRFIPAELSAEHAVKRLLETLEDYTKIDVLIHSAGINTVGAFVRSDIKTQCAVLDVNLLAPILLTNGLLANDRVRRGSSVIFVSSLSRYVSYPGASVYAASKDGISAYARSLSVALHPEGVHVLTVFPGPTRTPHAREHSPDNRNEAKRMPPEVLAEKIFYAQSKKHYTLIPGFANKLFAFTGNLFPTLTERIMKRTILDKLPPALPANNKHDK